MIEAGVGEDAPAAAWVALTAQENLGRCSKRRAVEQMSGTQDGLDIGDGERVQLHPKGLSEEGKRMMRRSALADPCCVDDGERVGSGGSVEIVDLTQEHLEGYLCCLEEWSDEMTEAGDHKARWYEVMKDRGLRVKLAMENGTPVGMIQYLPIEESIAEGVDLAMILCIWVHGYRERGVGDHQGHGIGTALLEAAEADALSLGFKGMAAWGVTMPFWMRASWFKKHGYRKADNAGGSELVWKRFVDDVDAPRWIRNGRVPEPVEGQVTVTGFLSGWCPAMNLTYERARRAAEEIGPPVVFVSIDTTEHHAKQRYGHSDTVFLDGKPLQTGKPPSYDTIERKVRKRVRSVTRH